jgi:hypothetical protein
VAPDTLPIVITLAAAPVPIFTAAVSASDAKLSAVPAVIIVADPLREARPLDVKVVKDPAAADVPPIAGGDAKMVEILLGTKTVFDPNGVL